MTETIRLNITVTTEQHEMLRKISYETKTSIAELVRQAIAKTYNE